MIIFIFSSTTSDPNDDTVKELLNVFSTPVKLFTKLLLSYLTFDFETKGSVSFSTPRVNFSLCVSSKESQCLTDGGEFTTSFTRFYFNLVYFCVFRNFVSFLLPCRKTNIKGLYTYRCLSSTGAACTVTEDLNLI